MSGTWEIRATRTAPALGWDVRRIGELVTLQNGYPFDSDLFGDTGDIPLVRIRDLAIREYGTFITGPVPSNSLIQNDDVIVGMDGDFNVALWDRGEAALNQRLCALRPRHGVDIRFVAYALPSVLQVMNDLTFSTTVKHLSSGNLLAEKIYAPDLQEQRRISDFLDAETSRLELATRVQSRRRDLLRERRTSAIGALVTGQESRSRRPSDLPWADTLPTDWQTVALSLFARMGSGHTPSRSRPEWWVDTSIPWITTGEVAQIRDDRREVIIETRECISEIGLANSAAEIHTAGTVVLSRTASAGFSAVMGRDMATSQDYVTWNCGPRLDPFYLLWCLRSMRQDLLGRLAMGSTHKTIYVPDLQELRIPLPPMAMQRQIVGRIRESNARHDDLLDAIERQIFLFAERRQALITAAVTGRTDVTTTRGVAERGL